MTVEDLFAKWRKSLDTQLKDFDSQGEWSR